MATVGGSVSAAPSAAAEKVGEATAAEVPGASADNSSSASGGALAQGDMLGFWRVGTLTGTDGALIAPSASVRPLPGASRIANALPCSPWLFQR